MSKTESRDGPGLGKAQEHMVRHGICRAVVCVGSRTYLVTYGMDDDGYQRFRETPMFPNAFYEKPPLRVSVNGVLI